MYGLYQYGQCGPCHQLDRMTNNGPVLGSFQLGWGLVGEFCLFHCQQGDHWVFQCDNVLDLFSILLTEDGMNTVLV